MNLIIYTLPLLVIALGAGLVIAMRWALRSAVDSCNEQFREQYQTNAKLLDVHPNEAPPAWVAAQTLLQCFMAQNVQQVRIIFTVSITVALAGFYLTYLGVMNLLTGDPHTPSQTSSSRDWASSVPVIAGILTQFIGATFLVMYKTASLNATESLGILGRMNEVGMAICVVRAIPDGNETLKATTLANLANLTVLPREYTTPLIRENGTAQVSEAPATATDSAV